MTTPGKRICASDPYVPAPGSTPDGICGARLPAGVSAARAFVAYPGVPASAAIDPQQRYARTDAQLYCVEP
jgi:hypothetical protein